MESSKGDDDRFQSMMGIKGVVERVTPLSGEARRERLAGPRDWRDSRQLKTFVIFVTGKKWQKKRVVRKTKGCYERFRA